MATHEIEVKKQELVIVKTGLGKLKFKTGKKEAVKLYAEAFDLTDEELAKMKPSVTISKEETRCLKTLESATSETSLTESSK